MNVLQPDGWERPRGFSHGVSAQGTTVFVAGQIGRTPGGELAGDGIAAQARQALANILTILAAGGAKAEHITRMNWYIVDTKEYVTAGREIGQAYREVIGNHYPAMTLLEVSRLLDEKAKVEIEVTAVVP